MLILCVSSGRCIASGKLATLRPIFSLPRFCRNGTYSFSFSRGPTAKENVGYLDDKTLLD